MRPEVFGKIVVSVWRSSDGRSTSKKAKRTDICVRQFRRSDLAAVKKLIYNTIDVCYLADYPKEAIQYFKEYHCDKSILKGAKDGYTIILKENNRIIATGTIIGDHILRVFVEPEFQRRGLGKLIMNKLEEKAVSKGIKVVKLDASLPSKKFYDSLGYTTLEKTYVKVDNGKKLRYFKMSKDLMSKIQIDACREDDFEQILGLLKQLWPDRSLDKKKLRQAFLRGLKSKMQCYLCARIEKNIVGFASLMMKNSLWQQGYVGHIDELIVDKQYRGKGIGSKFLEHITKVAKKKGCRRIELDSAFERKDAHKFYKRNDFENRAFLFSKKF
jgi:glucosamine-phosphate N-acetyltransferase